MMACCFRAVCGSASPPDVRRWLCLAVIGPFNHRALPLVRAPRQSRCFVPTKSVSAVQFGAEPDPGAKPKLLGALERRGRAIASHLTAEPGLGSAFGGPQQ